MRFVLFVIVVFILSMLFVISNNNLFLTNPNDLEFFFNSYLSWADRIANNSFVVTGKVVELYWGP